MYTNLSPVDGSFSLSLLSSLYHLCLLKLFFICMGYDKRICCFLYLLSLLLYLCKRLLALSLLLLYL